MDHYDLIDSNDQPIGKIADYDTVHKEGLWYRAVHVIIYTPTQQIIMQKRSPSLAYKPGEIEISVGGGVNAGETPSQACLREVKEELGIKLLEKDLHFIGKTKYNHRTKNQYIRNFIYSYAIKIPDDTKLKSNPDETSLVFTISKKQLRRALRRHRIKHIGKITGLYAYWKYLLNAIDDIEVTK